MTSALANPAPTAGPPSPSDDRTPKEPFCKEQETRPPQSLPPENPPITPLQPKPQMDPPKTPSNEPEPTPPLPPQPMSFREKILQGKRWMKKPMFEEDHEILMGEGDLIFDLNGPIPKAIISEKVEEQLSLPWENVLIVKPMGLSLTLSQIRSRLYTLWYNTDGFAVMDIERDYVMVKFWNEKDAKSILQSGPWMLSNSYLHVQKWDRSFDAVTNKINRMVVWIRLPGLPVHYYNQSFLRRLGRLMGKVIHIDHQTAAKSRGKFARMTIEIDMEKPVCTQFEMKGRIQHVEYENMPFLCQTCYMIGHSTRKCVNAQEEQRADESDWVEVTKRGKPSNQQAKTTIDYPREGIISGSRFSSLQDLDQKDAELPPIPRNVEKEKTVEDGPIPSSKIRRRNGRSRERWTHSTGRLTTPVREETDGCLSTNPPTPTPENHQPKTKDNENPITPPEALVIKEPSLAYKIYPAPTTLDSLKHQAISIQVEPKPSLSSHKPTQDPAQSGTLQLPPKIDQISAEIPLDIPQEPNKPEVQAQETPSTGSIVGLEDIVLQEGQCCAMEEDTKASPVVQRSL
ncbi:OLC1v1004006C1 [Oldenlandia corymbosa var. corymbosa]|uniref:OLC1v1004006C1 n=1 Tax=Oldenlandia corymbosa var. corymbosa TaxID=529605 RepID=A0AAV1DEQ0_OLDCO|nr:OLC1v1004006C1 [Oldenlandia corymbosa var. corymbosa]